MKKLLCTALALMLVFSVSSANVYAEETEPANAPIESEAPDISPSAEPTDGIDPTVQPLNTEAPVSNPSPAASDKTPVTDLSTIDKTSPYYLLEGNLAADGTYSIDVYLVTDSYITAGYFGVHYDMELDSKFSSFTLNTDNFHLYNALDNPRIDNSVSGDAPKGYIAFSWTLNTTNITEMPPSAPAVWHMSTITFDGVTETERNSWFTDVFRVQNWYATPQSSSAVYNKIVDYDTNETENNRTWRLPTEDELTADSSLVGWFQGFEPNHVTDPDDSNLTTQHDIDFVYTDPNVTKTPNASLTGYVDTWKTYNSAAYTEVYFFPVSNSGEVDYTDMSHKYSGNTYETDMRTNGRTLTKYTFTGLREGVKYVVGGNKSQHVLTVSDETTEALAAGDNTLTEDKKTSVYAGDVNDDNVITLVDRVILKSFINKERTDVSAMLYPIYERCDLDGDGHVTMADLTILRLYLNQKGLSL